MSHPAIVSTASPLDALLFEAHLATHVQQHDDAVLILRRACDEHVDRLTLDARNSFAAASRTVVARLQTALGVLRAAEQSELELAMRRWNSGRRDESRAAIARSVAAAGAAELQSRRVRAACASFARALLLKPLPLLLWLPVHRPVGEPLQHVAWPQWVSDSPLWFGDATLASLSADNDNADDDNDRPPSDVSTMRPLQALHWLWKDTIIASARPSNGVLLESLLERAHARLQRRFAAVRSVFSWLNEYQADLLAFFLKMLADHFRLWAEQCAPYTSSTRALAALRNAVRAATAPVQPSPPLPPTAFTSDSIGETTASLPRSTSAAYTSALSEPSELAWVSHLTSGARAGSATPASSSDAPQAPPSFAECRFALAQAHLCYFLCASVADSRLPPAHPLRLGCALNQARLLCDAFDWSRAFDARTPAPATVPAAATADSVSLLHWAKQASASATTSTPSAAAMASHTLSSSPSKAGLNSFSKQSPQPQPTSTPLSRSGSASSMHAVAQPSTVVGAPPPPPLTIAIPSGTTSEADSVSAARRSSACVALGVSTLQAAYNAAQMDLSKRGWAAVEVQTAGAVTIPAAAGEVAVLLGSTDSSCLAPPPPPLSALAPLDVVASDTTALMQHMYVAFVHLDSFSCGFSQFLFTDFYFRLVF